MKIKKYIILLLAIMISLSGYTVRMQAEEHNSGPVTVNATATARAGNQVLTLMLNGENLGDFDTFNAIQAKMSEKCSKAIASGDPELNYEIIVNQDFEMIDSVVFGWPYGQKPKIKLRSKEASNPVTVKSKGVLTSTGMIQVVGGIEFSVTDIILDGNHETFIFEVNAGNTTPDDPNSQMPKTVPSHLIVNEGAVLQHGKGNLGGAISMSRYGKVTINGGEIKANESPHGGAICNLSWEPLTINGGKIYNNNGKLGGALFLQPSEGMADTTIINGGEILANSAEEGGGVYLASRNDAQAAIATLTMNGGKISGNKATADQSYGGGVSVASGAVFNMIGGEISENKANYGGGIAVEGLNTQFSLTGGIVSKNGANIGGGICLFSSIAKPELIGGTISENQANYGGGIFSYYDKLEVGALNLTGNLGYKKGGGIYLTKPSKLKGTKISNNISLNGAGIYHSNPAGSTSEFDGIELSGNQAIDLGGGIYTYQGNLVIKNSQFNANRASNEEFLKDEQKAENRKGYGAGLAVIKDAKNLQTISVENTSFIGNEAYFGGGIFTETALTINNSSFVKNKAFAIHDQYAKDGQQNLGHGGAIYVTKDLKDGEKLIVDNSQFTENEADKSGGAISVNETTAIVRIQNNTVFTGNKVLIDRGHGGAIYSNLHAYNPTYDNGSHGNQDVATMQNPPADAFYINLDIDNTTVFQNNQTFRTFTPPANKADFTKLLFKETSHPNTKYDHILNNDDVNLKIFLAVAFKNNYSENDETIHDGFLVLEKNNFGTAWPQDPTREGYTFKGWNTQRDGQGTVIKKGELENLVVDKNLTYYAIWEVNTDTPDTPDMPITPSQPDAPVKPTAFTPKGDQTVCSSQVCQEDLDKLPQTGEKNNYNFMITLILLGMSFGLAGLYAYKRQSKLH